jgi:hypothetical protein
MDFKETYIEIIGKYENGNYTINSFSNKIITVNEEDFASCAIDYLIWHFMISKNDQRWKQILNFVLIPSDIKIDFSKIKFEDFFKFMVEIKNI